MAFVDIYMIKCNEISEYINHRYQEDHKTEDGEKPLGGIAGI
jgi:hypothetical protein